MKYYNENHEGLRMYLAGPWFRDDQMERNIFLKEATDSLLFNTFDPRTANLCPADATMDWKENAFQANVGAILESDVVLVTTDGLDCGTIFEAGIAYQAGIPIIYFAETLGDRQFNLMLAQSGIHVILSREQLVDDLANPELLECIKTKKVFKQYNGEIE